MGQPQLALSLGQIKSRVKRTFGDMANVQIIDQDIIDWSNAAMRELVKLNNLNKIKATAATNKGVKDYNLPVGVSGFNRVMYQNTVLEYLSLDAADQVFPNRDDATTASYPTGTPQYYWIYDDVMTLYPAPDTTTVGGLTLYYTLYPNALANDADVPSIPIEYHNRILDYCLAQAYELNGDLDSSQVKMNQFTQSRRELQGKDSESEAGPYPFITDLSNDYVDEYGG